MKGQWAITAISRSNLVLMVLFLLSLLMDLFYGDLERGNLIVFGIPFLVAFFLWVPFSGERIDFKGPGRKQLYKVAMISFLYLVVFGSLPFIISQKTDLISGLFESMAGFTTTGLSGLDPGELIQESHGLVFYRCAIQWAGGFIYLFVAFLLLSDLADRARRSVDRAIFSRIGLVTRYSPFIMNIGLLYLIFTVVALISFYLTGLDLFDSICLSLGTVSTGGFSSMGSTISGGAALKLFMVLFMILSGMGYYVHMSLFSARGRKKTLLDVENLIYLVMVFVLPILTFAVLLAWGFGFSDSLVNGSFAVISAMTTTGFMVEGMERWPDSLKLLLLVLMVVGGSSLSLSSGLKVQRVYLLVKGFFTEMQKSGHPRAVLSIRRGEGVYSGRALESANVVFFYIFLLLFITISITLIFEEDIFEAVALCVTSVSNSGIVFGKFTAAGSVASMNGILKIVLMLSMFLGRFEVLLPLYLMSPGSYRFSG